MGRAVRSTTPLPNYEHLCLGGCGRRVKASRGPLAYCGACWYVDETCRQGETPHLLALDSPEAVLRRVERLLTRLGAPDTDALIDALRG